jgi:outer membrane cobalamin receptor
MRIIYLIIILLGSIPCLLFGQEISMLKGKIIDHNTQEPLTGATIQIGGKAALSDYEGNFEITIQPGIYPLEVSYVGYESQRLDQTIEKEGLQGLVISLMPSTMLLEMATVTAGRFERPLSESTVSLDILRPQFIANTNAVALDEALNRMPGINIIDGQANIRGGSGYSYGAGSRVLVLVDDIPALQADAGLSNWNDLPIENLEQVEVLKGAASALYGSSALNGIINVRTAFAKSTPFTRVSTFYQAIMSPSDPVREWWSHSPATSGISLTHRQKVGRLDFSGSAFYINTASHIQEAYDEQGRITLGTRYRITDRLAIGLNANINRGRSLSYFLWENSGEGAYKGGGANNASISSKLRFFIDPYINYFDKHGNRHKILGRIYAIDNDNSLNQSNKSNLYYSEYQFQRHLLPWNLVLTAGVLGTITKVDAELYSETEFTSQNAAGYIQLEQKLWNWLTLNLGARYEYNHIIAPDSLGNAKVDQSTNEDARPVLRFGANAKMAPFTYLRGSFGQGYRFPTIAEKFINTAFGAFLVAPNLELTSETGWSAELGIRQGVQMGAWNGFLDIAGFWTEYQDMMEFVLFKIPFFQSQNIGNTVIRGFEIGYTGQGTVAGKNFNMFAGYTYIDPQYKTFGEKEVLGSSTDRNILKYRFQHSVKADLESQITRRFKLGISYQYNSFMEAIDNIFLIIPDVASFRESNQKGFSVLDFRAGFNLNEQIEAWFIVKNALNEAYSLRPALLEEPQSITIRLNLTL